MLVPSCFIMWALGGGDMSLRELEMLTFTRGDG